jgi:hypothetical protein
LIPVPHFQSRCESQFGAHILSNEDLSKNKPGEKSMKISAANFSVLTFLVVTLLTVATNKAQKLTAEDVAVKHLASIGTSEKIKSVKNRMALGISEFKSKLPDRQTGGKAVLVSDNDNLFFLTSFNSKEYPFEKIGYFSGKATLPFVSAGARSPLGAFVADHNNILSGGLLLGSISSTWFLLDSPTFQETIKFAGKKKIDGRENYVLDYFPKNNSAEFTVKLLFDAQTFQHTRTEYRHLIPPKQATFGRLGEEGGLKLTLIETFSEFKTTDGLTLPHLYKIQYLTDSSSGTYEYNWGVKIAEYRFNQNLDSNFFSFDEK